MADEKIGHDEIEALLDQTKGSEAPTPGTPASAEAAENDAEQSETSLQPNDIESLLQASHDSDFNATSAADSTTATASPTGIPEGDVEALLHQAEEALASVNQPIDALPPGVKQFELSDLHGAPASTDEATLDLIRDVELDLKIELGRTRMHLEDVLKLKRGAVVPLDKLAGDPVDVFVNGRLIARGEVLVLNDNFCIRVAELISGETQA